MTDPNENPIDVADEIARQIAEYETTEDSARENVADMLGISYDATFDLEDQQRAAR